MTPAVLTAVGGFLTGLGAFLGVVLPWWRKRTGKRVSEFNTLLDGMRAILAETREHSGELQSQYGRALAELEACLGERRGNRRRIEELEEQVRKQSRRIEEQDNRIAELQRTVAELGGRVNGG